MLHRSLLGSLESVVAEMKRAGSDPSAVSACIRMVESSALAFNEGRASASLDELRAAADKLREIGGDEERHEVREALEIARKSMTGLFFELRNQGHRRF